MIQFVINEACNEFASLEITPAPKKLNRVYMIWTVPEQHHKVFIKSQKLRKLDRSGFDVLEWGGIELL